MEEEENNRLIADFMGWESHKYDHLPDRVHKGDQGLDLRNTKYHNSWDWLMPVVDKIEGLKLGDVVIKTLFDDEDLYRDANAYFRIEYSNAYIDLCGTMKLYESLIAIEDKPTKIEATYKAAVEFIQWYNELKQQQ